MSGVTEEVENNTEYDTEYISFVSIFWILYGIPFALSWKGYSLSKKEKGSKVLRGIIWLPIGTGSQL